MDFVARGVVRLLRYVLPDTNAEDVIGDLIEHYERRRVLRRSWLILEAWKLAWAMRRGRQLVVPQDRARTLHIDIWLRDVRYASRSLFRSRGFAGVALTSLALGLGLTTAVFSVIDGILFRPLPYKDADAIVRIREVGRPNKSAGDDVSRLLLQAWEGDTRTVVAFAPYSISDVRIGAGAESFVGVKVGVAERFFDVLRTTPFLGRLLDERDSDSNAPKVVVLTHAFWKRAFAADPNIIGHSILIDDGLATIAGVVPNSFAYPSAEVAVYVPERWRLPAASPGVGRAFAGLSIELLARMRPGTAPSDVAREGALIALRERSPTDSKKAAAVSLQALRLQDDLVKDARPALMMLVASVACVLAIVVVNLTNLLLARGTARQREMAVRAALGASRLEMARPLVIESVLLSLIGGAFGLLVAWLLTASIPLSSTIDPMLAALVRIDGRVLAFTLGISGSIGIAIGLLPAWQAPFAQVKSLSSSHVQVLPGTALRAERLRGALVVVQVALAMVLAVAATLLSRSLVTMVTVDLGFHPEHALSFQVRLPPGGSTFDWRARFYEALIERLSTHSGVQAVGLSTSLPMHEAFSQNTLTIDGVAPPEPGTSLRAHREVVTPGYFAAIGLPVTGGRTLTASDTARSERVMVVNEAFGAAFLGGGDPIGRRVMVFGDWHRVVGVVKSKRHSGPKSERRPEMYVALAQAPPDSVSDSGTGVVLRASASPGSLLPFVRAAVRDLSSEAAVASEAALEDQLWATTAQPRFYATVMGVFAALALVTALVGLYGVLSYLVERRRVEIGVRRALGATNRDISGLVIMRGLKLVAIAMPIGLTCAAAAAGLLRNALFGITPMDLATFAGVVIFVPIVALAACVWPVRRATRIAPLEALRDE